MRKIKIVVLYGGRSVEHEVSCRSAAFVLKNLDPKKYDVKVVGIDKNGFWLPQSSETLLTEARSGKLQVVPIKTQVKSLPVFETARGDEEGDSGSDVVFFPVLHGTFGEDGSLQGMLDLADAAYVGCDTLGSAVGMDKVIAKKLAAAAGIDVVPFVDLKKQFWVDMGPSDKKKFCENAISKLNLPIFVKPARLGSSVGVEKAKTLDALTNAIDAAFAFDDKILLETFIDARELEVAVLGDYDPKVSVVGEISMRQAEFYDYHSKYEDPDAALIDVPAKLDAKLSEKVRQVGIDVFKALELYGMARIDFFLDKKSGKVYFNEVNTIPGFTSVSQYPMLWKASGVDARQLLDELVSLAIKRRDSKRSLKRSKV